jgi:hypothetical protein
MPLIERFQLALYALKLELGNQRLTCALALQRADEMRAASREVAAALPAAA